MYCNISISKIATVIQHRNCNPCKYLAIFYVNTEETELFICRLPTPDVLRIDLPSFSNHEYKIKSCICL